MSEYPDAWVKGIGLLCGPPLPVGEVNLRTGERRLYDTKRGRVRICGHARPDELSALRANHAAIVDSLPKGGDVEQAPGASQSGDGAEGNRPASVGSVDEVERARKAILSYAFQECQPNRGDVFSWIDDHAEAIALAALQANPLTKDKANG